MGEETVTDDLISKLKGLLGEAPEGHCKDAHAWAEMVDRYHDMPRERLCGGDMTDFALANHVFMADRMGLDLIGAQTAAKDRIRWLSIQLAITIARAEAAESALAASKARVRELEEAVEAAPILSKYHTAKGFNESFFADYAEWKARARALLSSSKVGA